MRFDGVIKTWDDVRGAGTIEPLRGGDEIAVHITAFARGQPRPRVRQRVSFEVELSHDGSKRASAVRIHENVRPSAAPSRSVRTGAPRWPGVLAVLAFMALYAMATMRGQVAPAVGIVYLALSLLAFGAMVQDKTAVRTRRTRVPDQLWLLLAVTGGWPGMLLAVLVLGHEPGRRLSRAALWLAVLANVAVFAFFAWPTMRI
jgi:uncharacterized membrane protein YsdA (DUF1294 family)/cold shock CspA family protein